MISLDCVLLKKKKKKKAAFLFVSQVLSFWSLCFQANQ